MALKTTISVKIVGAGSIGNHLSHAARNMNWEVFVTDNDPLALARMKSDIYPTRYGNWDSKIKLVDFESDDTLKIKSKIDIVFICTPPDSHLDVALVQIKKHKPKMVFIEKPLSNPGNFLKIQELIDQAHEFGTQILVGYNHRLTPNTQYLIKLLQKKTYGEIRFIRASFRESKDGILQAHPWLEGLSSSYLGKTARGGGALFEHSHGLDLLLYIAKQANLSPFEVINCSFQKIKTADNLYDDNVICTFKFDNNAIGIMEQNFITKPAVKSVEIEFEKSNLKWFSNSDSAGVEVYDHSGKLLDSLLYGKTRKQDFEPQIQHIQNLFLGIETDSPIEIHQIVPTQQILDTLYEKFVSEK